MDQITKLLDTIYQFIASLIEAISNIFKSITAKDDEEETTAEADAPVGE